MTAGAPRADLLALAAAYGRQLRGEDASSWSPEEWRSRAEELLVLVQAERSPYRLGEVLHRDVGLDFPVAVIKGCYQRLFELGVTDVRTRVCYARYLLLHGPQWDEEANRVLAETEPLARAAQICEADWLGHHPVFFRGPATSGENTGSPTDDDA